MKDRTDYYTSQHTGDYSSYVWDCLDRCIEQLGTSETLDALAQALGDDILADMLIYIDRDYELNLGDDEEDEDDDDEEEEGGDNE